MTGLSLNGAPAFRDLGGIATGDGRHIRRGRLFRSEVLLNLGSDDQAIVGGLGLRVVCDLRSASERATYPCMAWLDPPPRFMTFNLEGHITPATSPAMERMLEAPAPDAALQVMMSTYEALPRACVEALRSIFEGLLAGETPLMIHCSAGKDRTGFVSAMLLSALGVPRESVYEDYLRTGAGGYAAHAARTAQLMALFLQQPLDAESLAVFSGLRRAYLEASFAALETEWGSVDRYLADAANLDAGAQLSLQELLLESEFPGQPSKRANVP